MAKLTFTLNDNGKYVAEVTASADFNLHVERADMGVLNVDVSTVDGAQYYNEYSKMTGKVFDRDFQALVYPKYIRVTSDNLPDANNCYITEKS